MTHITHLSTSFLLGFILPLAGLAKIRQKSAVNGAVHFAEEAEVDPRIVQETRHIHSDLLVHVKIHIKVRPKVAD